MKIITFLAISIFLFNICLSQDQNTKSEATLKDQLSTLKLDQKLHSRSQLGGMAVDRLGFIYIANFSDALWRISPKGEVKLISDGLYGSSGITIDQQGNIYQANFFGHNIIKIDRFGNISPFLEEGLKGPVGMIFDKQNNLYVCNCNDNSIKKITQNKEVSIFAEGDIFNCPNGITTDSDDNLYVVNFGNNDIIKIDLEGKMSKLATTPGVDGNAHIAFLKNNFFVTKIKNNTLYKVTSTGKVALFAGTGKAEITDGNALEASIARPNGIAVDGVTGVIYLNNLNGIWSSKQETSIEIRKIVPVSVTKILKSTFKDKGIEAGQKAYWTYQKDEMHSHEELGSELGNLGWFFMGQRQVKEAITTFTLLSETYPDRWLPLFYLGDTYKIIGQADKAIEYYKKSLDKKPGNVLVSNKLKALEEGK